MKKKLYLRNKNLTYMYYQRLSDREIIKGFRKGDASIIREYFYGYCRVGYQIFDQRYQLSSKENLDFMSLAHQYAIYLMEHDWKPLEDHSGNVSLRTWLINGFRYIVLDALKWYRKEYGSLTYEDYLQSFDITSDLRLQFNKMIQDICDHVPLTRQERLILEMVLHRGFKGKEVAVQMGLTPSAISQQFKQLKERIVIPYFKKNFDMDFDMPEVMDEQAIAYEPSMGVGAAPDALPIEMINYSRINQSEMQNMKQKRVTPERITSLQPGEIFVFGSNLKGMHGGGAAYVAYRKFGAVMGVGVGLQGQSYAIPTMQGGVETIRPYVDQFIEFADLHPELTFLVTRIGCGIAGFSDEDIAPLFEKAHDKANIVLPPGW